MKKLCGIFLLLFSLSALAQPPVKLYAYSQETTPGTIPVDENGNPIRPRGPLLNYFFFAAYSSSYTIRFDGIWIKGKGFSVQTSKVASTPVTITNNNIPSNPVTTVLVPATKLMVISIQPISPSGNSVNSSWFRELAKKNELIISYYYKGKKYFIQVKKIKVLPPVAGV
jgi:hypothetical protein